MWMLGKIFYIKILAREGLGYYELKQHETYLEKRYSKL
jgi:hypothetical protein